MRYLQTCRWCAGGVVYWLKLRHGVGSRMAATTTKTYWWEKCV